jgi:hypothetical protein
MAALLLGASVLWSCGGNDRTDVGGVSGTGGQVGVAGSGTGGGGGTPNGGNGPGPGGMGGGGTGGSAGGGTGEPTLCLAPSDPFAWPTPQTFAVPASESWKADLALPNDPFLSQGTGFDDPRWIKFIALASEPGKIYFQNSSLSELAFHYEFARDFIPEFSGMTRAQFDAVTLENEGRRAVLGAVLVPADSALHPEYAVQLVSNDDLHPELVATLMQSVAAHVTAPDNTRAYYFPSGTSATCLESKLADFTQRGINVASVDRWLSGDACYSGGWAVGRLVQLAAADVDAAYLDGRLTPDDILLLTDTAPAELPFVAGILTLAPSTPNAHSAILARSYSVPFAYLREPSSRAQAQALAGKRAVLSTTGMAGRNPFSTSVGFGSCEPRFIDAEGLSAEDLATLKALAAPPAVVVTPKRASGAMTLPVVGLVPSDIDRVGGKAANFGLLQAASPATTPSPALALTFDVWDAFLDSPAPAGATGSLRDEIARRLAPHTWPADLRLLDATLESIRTVIEEAPFPPALASAVTSALAPFEPTRRIRFRSSTNVEDSETFTGAGLYDSATGCLADDLDADSAGPSLCNPDELGERGVYRAIQRVYASFYFRNAYFERLRRGVNEQNVGMGVLVHYSVPDPEELANGVATLTLGELSGSSADLVSQAGAVSVTNPDGSALPEQVIINRDGGTYMATVEGSSLLPLGANVLEFEAEYSRLMDVFDSVANQYTLATGKTRPFALDFEYKKIAPGVLSVRQVRPLPLPDTTRDVTPLLVASTDTLCIYGSERMDAMATHRLKTRIAVSSPTLRFTPEQLGSALYDNLRIEYLAGTSSAVVEGAPSALPGASHALESLDGQATVLDGWTTAQGAWTLRTRLATQAARNESPVRTLDDAYFELGVTWSTPVPFLNYVFDEEQQTGGFVPDTRSEELAELWGYCPEDITETEGLPYIQQSFAGPNGLAVQTSYWYPPPPRGVSAGYTAPALKWERTTISGLTSEPIVLTDYFSQTYAPNHHNFGGQYVFDPRLEPNLSQAARNELQTADVAFILIIDQDGIEDELWVSGFDGALRKP